MKFEIDDFVIIHPNTRTVSFYGKIVAFTKKTRISDKTAFAFSLNKHISVLFLECPPAQVQKLI